MSDSETEKDDTDSVETKSDSSEKVIEKKPKKAGKLKAEGTSVTSTRKAPGLNYSAIAIGLLFVLPVICTLVFQAFDMLYPQLALDRLVRGKVAKCYDVAKPDEIVDIDKIMKKYNGKYQSLFNNLGNKYSKFPQCRGLN